LFLILNRETYNLIFFLGHSEVGPVIFFLLQAIFGIVCVGPHFSALKHSIIIIYFKIMFCNRVILSVFVLGKTRFAQLSQNELDLT
jgi:hypothetical protein